MKQQLVNALLNDVNFATPLVALLAASGGAGLLDTADALADQAIAENPNANAGELLQAACDNVFISFGWVKA